MFEGICWSLMMTKKMELMGYQKDLFHFTILYLFQKGIASDMVGSHVGMRYICFSKIQGKMRKLGSLIV